jgi:hypothetical protein
VLWWLCLSAIGGTLPVPVILASFAVERVLSMVPLTPGGAGLAEAGTVVACPRRTPPDREAGKCGDGRSPLRGRDRGFCRGRSGTVRRQGEGAGTERSHDDYSRQHRANPGETLVRQAFEGHTTYPSLARWGPE